MKDQIAYGLIEISQQATFGYLPHFNSAILWTTGYDVVIMRTPLEV